MSETMIAFAGFEMDYQMLFNVALGGFSFLAGFLLNNIWREIKALQSTDTETVKRIGAIEVLIAGDYVKRDEFRQVADKIFTKLDAIADNLSRKADK